MRFGPRRLSRDIRLVQQKLLSEGRAVWLGDKYQPAASQQSSDIERAVQRVRQLFPGVAQQ
jgi:hypothetical protein